MPTKSDIFRFRHFAVNHGQSSIRVGTDGVLVGAWAGEGCSPRQVLDIGCGCGLIALMMAQRFPAAHVVGIDIDAPSVCEARTNAEASPYSDRVTIVHGDIVADHDIPHSPFDLIVSNPPFFEEDTPAATLQANRAKHTVTLTFDVLLERAAALLTPGGHFAAIIPYGSASRFVGIAAQVGLHLCRRCDVRGSERRECKRSLLEFLREPCNPHSAPLNPQSTKPDLLTIRTASGTYTDEYRTLVQDFQIKF